MSRDPKSNVMNREAFQAEQRTEGLNIPYLAIRGHLCFRCLLPAEKLTKCGGCKHAVYCGKDCQSRDWKLQHKNDCKILKAVNEVEGNERALSRSRSEWTKSLQQKVVMVQNLTEDTTPLDIVQRQAHCIQCYRSSIQLPPGTVLIPCQKCHLVASCSSCTKTPFNHRQEECKKYQQIGTLEKYQIEQFNTSGRVYSMAPTEKPRPHYRALKTAPTWFQYFTEISDKKDVVDNFITPEDFELNDACVSLADAATQAAIRNAWLFLLNSTESQSMPLTVLAGLEDTIADLLTRKKLTVHFVGASQKELHCSMVFEELFHLLPALKTLQLVMVGPEYLRGGSGTTLGEEMKMDCCPKCTTSSRKRTMQMFAGMYHEFGALPTFTKPDLAVLFHSGRSQAEVESWKPTTKFLVDMAIPTVCTTYTAQEASEEVADLHSLGANMIKDPDINTWRSLIHLPETLEGEEGSFYYCNYYRYIFQGRKSS